MKTGFRGESREQNGFRKVSHRSTLYFPFPLKPYLGYSYFHRLHHSFVCMVVVVMMMWVCVFIQSFTQFERNITTTTTLSLIYRSERKITSQDTNQLHSNLTS